MARPSSKDSGPTATDLIEESVHLLRKNPRELIWYYAGAGPFAVALLYFWAYVTWFVPPDGEVAAGALFLAVVFCWMKAAQRRFALGVCARRMGDEPSRWSYRKWTTEISTQLRLQSSGILLVPLSLIFAVPFGWVYAYYQSATVAPEAGDASVGRHERAVAQAKLWPKQNHAALAILSGLWLMVFLNVAAAFYLVPMLASRWLGLKTIFALEGWSYFNSTFLILVTVLTHLLVDPLIKIFYVLRVFHADARKTGIDVTLVLKRERLLRRRTASGAALLLVLGFGLAPSPRAQAAEVAAETRVVSTQELDRSLNQVLEEPDFRWRLRPTPAPPSKEKEGMIKGFIRSTFSILKQMAQTVSRWFHKMSDWISDLFPGKKEEAKADEVKNPGNTAGFDWMAGLQLAAYILLIAVIVLLVFVALKVWRHNRSSRPFAASAQLPAAAPDLHDESVEASRLPADGWLELARQKVAAGEWRLALRALFLATLARHAHQGWVSLAKFKTNLDYEVELKRRVPSRPAVVDEFRTRRRRFEEVWYGTLPASDGLVRDWLQQMEGQG